MATKKVKINTTDSFNEHLPKSKHTKVKRTVILTSSIAAIVAGFHFLGPGAIGIMVIIGWCLK